MYLLLNIPSLHGLLGMSQKEAHNTLWFVALETLILIVIFMLIVECAGRKTVAQMTMLQMIVTIGIGEALLMPVSDEEFSILKTVVIVAVLIAFVIFTEWLEVKFWWFERLITNKALVVVENGKINVKNLRKLRMTVDQLEMQVRNMGVSSTSCLKVATIEANGQLGWELSDDDSYLTVGDLKDFINKEFPNSHVDNDQFKEVVDFEHRVKNNNTESDNLK